MSNPPAAPVPSTAEQIQQLQQQLADMQAALLAKPPLPLQPSLSPPPSPSFPPPATILNDSVMLILVITLAVVVVFVFVRRWRPTLIVGAAIPLSLITTFGMIWLFDFTLNRDNQGNQRNRVCSNYSKTTFHQQGSQGPGQGW